MKVQGIKQITMKKFSYLRKLGLDDLTSAELKKQKTVDVPDNVADTLLQLGLVRYIDEVDDEPVILETEVEVEVEIDEEDNDNKSIKEEDE